VPKMNAQTIRLVVAIGTLVEAFRQWEIANRNVVEALQLLEEAGRDTQVDPQIIEQSKKIAEDLIARSKRP